MSEKTLIKRKINKSPNNKYISLIKGNIKGLLVLFIGIVVISALILKTYDTVSVFYTISYVFIAFGAFVTGVNVKKKTEGRGFVVGILSVIPYTIISLIIIIAISGWDFDSKIILTPVIALVSGAIGGILAVNSKI